MKTKCKITHGKNAATTRLTLCGLILSISILSCTALPLQLGGDIGRSILENIAANNTTNQTESFNETTPGDLWSWGSIPVGHALNESGRLVMLPTATDPYVIVPPAQNSGP